MTADEIIQIRSWIDLGIKGVIGLVVSLVGIDYRNLKNSLFELEKTKYEMSTQLQVTQSELVHVKKSLDRIEGKLDNLQK